MDYYKIGQRIRKYRKALNMSQEELAEKVEISVTHMSHIETGNTKLSLPVIVKLAEVLSVKIDDLIYDNPIYNKSEVISEVSEVIDSCSPQQARIILESVKNLKISFDKYFKI